MWETSIRCEADGHLSVAKMKDDAICFYATEGDPPYEACLYMSAEQARGLARFLLAQLEVEDGA